MTRSRFSMGDKRRIITFVCQTLHEVDNYDRLRPPLEKQGWTVVFVTHLFSAWLRAKSKGIPVTLTGRTANANCPVLQGPIEEEVIGVVSPAMSRRFQHSLWDALEYSAQAHPPEILAQWSGFGVAGRVATAFAKARGIRTVYLELGNIEPKMFADPEGTNAAAKLAREPHLLDRNQVSDAEIAAWKEQILAQRRRMTVIPQAVHLRRLNPWFIVDLAARILRAAPYPRRQSISERLMEKVRLAMYKPRPPVKPDQPYIFLPLQVSRDSNLVIFSDYDNLTALDFAMERARAAGLLLVVKPHPAETDILLLEEIARRCTGAGALLTSYNTTELVLSAREVVTINSTVGMEARLLDVPVTILGQSLYGAMTSRQIAVLAMRHLVDFSPFGSEPASDSAARQFLDLAQ